MAGLAPITPIVRPVAPIPRGTPGSPLAVPRATPGARPTSAVVHIPTPAADPPVTTIARASAVSGNSAFDWINKHQLLALVNGALPQWSHTIVVTCVGGPLADIRRIWYLSLAAAFGRYRDRVASGSQGLTIEGTWLVSDKTVVVKLGYSSLALAQVPKKIVETAQGVLGAVVSSQPAQKVLSWLGVATETVGITFESLAFFNTEIARLHRGPQQLTIGGSWPAGLVNTRGDDPARRIYINWFESACKKGKKTKLATLMATTLGKSVFRESPLPFQSRYPTALHVPRDVFQGLVRASAPFVTIFAGENVMLPDSGRVITTAEKSDPNVQPPTPAIDGISRTSVLEITAAALSTPCFLPASTGCTETKAWTYGVYAWNPTGQFIEYPAEVINLMIRDTSLAVSPSDKGIPDVPVILPRGK